MDALIYQLILDQAFALQRLGDSNDDVAELLKRSIVTAFERIQAQEATLLPKDWRELSGLLTELNGVMSDDDFAYSGIVLSVDPAKSRIEINLRPFLERIRANGIPPSTVE